MTHVWRRLARTSPGELRFRCLDAAAVAAEAVRFAAGRERWGRDLLRARLVPAAPELERATGALDRGEWREAGAALRTHFVQRPARFVIDPGRHAAIASAARAQFPSCVEDAVNRAERLLAGRYDLLGYHDLSFGDGGRVDWHADPISGRRAPVKFWAQVPYLDPASGDHKVIWELNRHQHWLALGRAAWLTADRRYADAVIRELESWLAANPPLAGINWSSMLEVALRSISWLWALHLLAPLRDESESEWILDLLVGLDRQLDHVTRHLSFYFSPNTHLLGEALALYVAGRVLPELRSAGRWERTGRDLLIREARAQVLADGGHAELSTHYHRYALDFYLLALVIARGTADPAAEHFEEVATRMASYCRTVAADDGRLPAIGDDDGGMLFPMCGRAPADARDSLALAAALVGRPELAVGPAPEEAFWMLAGECASDSYAPSPPVPSRLFPDTGYAVLRSRASHAIFDAGRHGFLNAGHAHADALGLVLSAGGRPVLIDPGTAVYTMDCELRDRFRSTAMHNTVMVDGQPQSVPAGPFQWSSRANARVTLWRPGAALDYVEAEHDGYLPLIHRRAVVRFGELWLIVDHILGTGRHRADAYWHFDPAWTLTGCRDADASFVHVDGSCAALATTATQRREFHGDERGLGWSAPVYGQLVPAPTLSFSESATAPMSLVTAVTAAAARVRLSVASNAVTIDRQDGWHRAAVTVRCNDARMVALFATPLGGAPGPRSVQRVVLPDAELATDARVAVLRLSGTGEPAALSLIDATTASWSGNGAFCLPPMEGGDLHLDSPALGQLHDAAHVRLVG